MAFAGMTRWHQPCATAAFASTMRTPQAACFAFGAQMRFQGQTATGEQQQQKASTDFEYPEDAGVPSNYNPWEVMGLKEGASHHDVRMQYQELLNQYHPDYVPKGTLGDVDKLREVEEAYNYIITSPTIDKKYRNLVSKEQAVYYKVLPAWMARNLDEMPRYYSWLRYKCANEWHIMFMTVVVFLCLVRFAKSQPEFFFYITAAFIIDSLFHTMILTYVVLLLVIKAVGTGNTIDDYNSSWLQSPKGFLTRGISY